MAPTPGVLDPTDQRLVAALQCDGRLTAERAAAVLGLSARTVRRRWRTLMADGTVQVIIGPSVHPAHKRSMGALLLRIKVLPGKLDAIVSALVHREDVPFLRVSTSGDEILAVARSEPGSCDPLVFRQLPSSDVVTAVETATILHVFRLVFDWRHDVLTEAERAALSPAVPATRDTRDTHGIVLDPLEQSLANALAHDARLSSAVLAERTGHPETTVRRRLARLVDEGRLVTHVVVEPRLLGLDIEATVMLRVSPDRLDPVGRALAGHPAVHGAVATSGAYNLYASIWLPDLAALYEFVSQDLADLGIIHAECTIACRTGKRLGARPIRWG